MCINFVHATNAANHYATPPTVCGCLSIRPVSVPANIAGLLLWARLTGDIDWLLQQQWANAGSATLSEYVGSWTCLCCVVVGSSGCHSNSQPVWRGQRHGTGPGQRGEVDLFVQTSGRIHRTAAAGVQSQGQSQLQGHAETAGSDGWLLLYCYEVMLDVARTWLCAVSSFLH